MRSRRPTALPSHPSPHRPAGAASRRPAARSSRVGFEPVEPRQLFAIIGPDLKPVSMSLSGADPVSSSHNVIVNFTITNTAFLWGDAGAFDVGFYESDQDPAGGQPISAGLIGEVHVNGLKNGASYSGSTVLHVSGDVTDNKSAILIYIDDAGTVDEVNESNNFYDPSDFGEGSGWANVSLEGDLVQAPSTTTAPRSRYLPMDGATASTIGDEGIGSRDEDIYDFNVAAGKHYMVDLDKTTGSNLDSYVRIYDQNWNLIAANDNGRDEGEGPGTDAYVEFNSGASFTTYHAVVSNAFNTNGDPRTMDGRTYSGSAAATGGYVISVHSIAANPIVTTTVIDNSATEGTTDNTISFRFYRSGSPDAPLNVLFTTTGTANSLNDYTLSDARTGARITTNFINIPAGAQYADVTVTAIDDNWFEGDESVGMYPLQIDPYLVGNGTIPLATIHNNPLQPPTVLGGHDTFTGRAAPSVVFDFDQDVSAGFDANALSLVNLTSGLTIDSSKLAFTWSGTHLSVTFPGFTNGVLPDGNYQLTVLGSRVHAANGVAMQWNPSQTFFSLAGDLNRDRKVDFSDLLILARNYGKTGLSLADGNADYSADGSVNFSDLLTLARQYGHTVPQIVYAAPAPAADAVAAPRRPATADVFGSSTPIA